LLNEAVSQTLRVRLDVGVWTLTVCAINDAAAAFCAKDELQLFPLETRAQFLTFGTIDAAVAKGEDRCHGRSDRFERQSTIGRMKMSTTVDEQHRARATLMRLSNSCLRAAARGKSVSPIAADLNADDYRKIARILSDLAELTTGNMGRPSIDDEARQSN
jgi:hypothetical protein